MKINEKNSFNFVVYLNFWWAFVQSPTLSSGQLSSEDLSSGHLTVHPVKNWRACIGLTSWLFEVNSNIATSFLDEKFEV